MTNIVGFLTGLLAMYYLISGAISAYAKPILDSQDMLLIGVTLAIISQFLVTIANKKAEQNGDTPLGK
jgi:hypothetical protein